MTLKLLPDTLLGRTGLVLLAALAVALGAALVLLTGRSHEVLDALGGRHAAERVAGLVRLLEDTPPPARRAALHNLETPGLRTFWSSEAILAATESRGIAGHVAALLAGSLEEREVRASTHPPTVRPAPDGEGRGFGRRMMMHEHGPGGILHIAVRLRDGSWLNVAAPLEPPDPLWSSTLAVPMALALVLVLAAALWAVRRAALPFGTFAAAAERLGTQLDAPPLDEGGPREVRQAARAFNIMQGRIRRFVADRTTMLAAISHDLKTPITRLRLRAEFIDDDEQRAKMLADLAEMEAMIAATLAFARDDAARETPCRVDLASLLQGLADDLGIGAAYAGPASLVLPLRPLAIKRALANLLDNAVKYGGGVRVACASEQSFVTIAIDDDGPGIPEADLERVFHPFVRLETSRSRETGGSGLGLAIARAAILAHGGDISLVNRPEGGLRVLVRLPG